MFPIFSHASDLEQRLPLNLLERNYIYQVLLITQMTARLQGFESWTYIPQLKMAAPGIWSCTNPGDFQSNGREVADIKADCFHSRHHIKTSYFKHKSLSFSPSFFYLGMGLGKLKPSPVSRRLLLGG